MRRKLVGLVVSVAVAATITASSTPALAWSDTALTVDGTPIGLRSTLPNGTAVAGVEFEDMWTYLRTADVSSSNDNVDLDDDGLLSAVLEDPAQLAGSDGAWAAAVVFERDLSVTDASYRWTLASQNWNPLDVALNGANKRHLGATIGYQTFALSQTTTVNDQDWSPGLVNIQYPTAPRPWVQWTDESKYLVLIGAHRDATDSHWVWGIRSTYIGDCENQDANFISRASKSWSATTTTAPDFTAAAIEAPSTIRRHSYDAGTNLLSYVSGSPTNEYTDRLRVYSSYTTDWDEVVAFMPSLESSHGVELESWTAGGSWVTTFTPSYDVTSTPSFDTTTNISSWADGVAQDWLEQMENLRDQLLGLLWPLQRLTGSAEDSPTL